MAAAVPPRICCCCCCCCCIGGKVISRARERVAKGHVVVVVTIMARRRGIILSVITGFFTSVVCLVCCFSSSSGWSWVVSGDEVELFGTVPPYLIYTAYRYFIACIGLPISSYYITVPVPKLRTHRIAFPVGQRTPSYMHRNVNTNPETLSLPSLDRKW